MQFTFDTTKLKSQVEENPLIAAGIVAAILTGVSRLMNANTAARNSKTYKKEVDRRVQLTK